MHAMWLTRRDATTHSATIVKGWGPLPQARGLAWNIA